MNEEFIKALEDAAPSNIDVRKAYDNALVIEDILNEARCKSHGCITYEGLKEIFDKAVENNSLFNDLNKGESLISITMFAFDVFSDKEEQE